MAIKVLLALLPFVRAAIFPDCVNGPKLLTTNLVCNTTASPSERAAALVAGMTIGERLDNLAE